MNKKMNVQNMLSNNGNKVPNQFIIHDRENGLRYFQSYNSIIVKVETGPLHRTVYLDKYYYNYSRTTAKYRNIFLGENSKEIQDKINSGVYTLIDLNKGEWKKCICKM